MKEKRFGSGRVVSLGCTDEAPYDFTVSNDKPGNAEEYAAERCAELEGSPLAGKNIFWMGSSVTYGFGSRGETMADYMAKRNGLISWKSAISGTTLADVAFGEEADNPWQARIAKGMPEETCRDISRLSYLRRMADFPEDVKPDLFVLQLSTNDSQFPMKHLGTIEAGFDEEAFDGRTTYGAMQRIFAQARRRWGCPVMVYASPLLDTQSYIAMVGAAKTLCEKWGAYLLDMNGDQAFSEIGRAHMEEYMSDPVHPLRRGYLEWWTPRFEEAAAALLRGKEEA